MPRLNCFLHHLNEIRPGFTLSWLMPASLLLASCPLSAQIYDMEKPQATVSVQQLQVPAKAQAELEKSLKDYFAGRVESAKSRVEHALEIAPTFAGALAWRGVMSADDKEYVAACADLERAVSLDPNFSPAYLFLANTYNAIGRWQDAEHALTLPLRTIPDWRVYYELAWSEAAQSRIPSAMQALARAEEIANDNVARGYLEKLHTFVQSIEQKTSPHVK